MRSGWSALRAPTPTSWPCWTATVTSSTTNTPRPADPIYMHNVSKIFTVGVFFPLFCVLCGVLADLLAGQQDKILFTCSTQQQQNNLFDKVVPKFPKFYFCQVFFGFFVPLAENLWFWTCQCWPLPPGPGSCCMVAFGAGLRPNNE